MTLAKLQLGSVLLLTVAPLGCSAEDGSVSGTATTADTSGDTSGTTDPREPSESSTSGVGSSSTSETPREGTDSGESSSGDPDVPPATEDICNEEQSICLHSERDFGFVGWVATGDVDGDGDTDLAYTLDSGGYVLHLSDGDTLDEGTFFDQPGSPRLESGREHGIAIISADLQTVALVGPRGPVFETSVPEVANFDYNVRAGDVDGDGTLDIVGRIYEKGTLNVQVVRGLGGSLELEVISLPAWKWDAGHISAVMDLDGDGFDDVLTAHDQPSTLLRGSAQGLLLAGDISIDGFFIAPGNLRRFVVDGETRYLQEHQCSDCPSLFGGYSVYRQLDTGTFETLGNSGANNDFLGNDIEVVTTSHGTYAVALAQSQLLQFPPGDAESYLSFQAIDAYDVQLPVQTLAPLAASFRGTLRLGGDDQMLVMIGESVREWRLQLLSLDASAAEG